jgi:RHH-type rel operon transcriptional repressor/antitoxin RelB
MGKVLSIRLGDGLAARLDAVAASTRRSRSTYVREALEAHIDQIEWEQRILRNVEDVRAGRRSTVSDAEARKILDLEG